MDEQRVKARSARLVVQQLEVETIVYDLDRDTAHCLDDLTTSVWQRCDGEATVAEVAELIGASHEAVWIALTQLSKAKLLDGELSLPAEVRGLTRREMLARVAVVGGGAAAISLVTSVKVPPAAQAASCLPNGASCTNGSQCCSGFCCPPSGFGSLECHSSFIFGCIL